MAHSWAGAYLLRRGLFLPYELKQVMNPEMAREGLRRLQPLRRLAAMLSPDPGSDIGRVCVLESAHYMRNQLLRDADWAGMAHGVEIRVPLVDMTLLERLAPAIPRLAPQTGKAALAKAPTLPLPSEIVARAKTGFARADRGVDECRRQQGCGGRAGPSARGQGADVAPLVANRAARLCVMMTRQGHCLALVTDAFGGHGGIAQYNRDFLCALAESGAMSSITVLPRRAPERTTAPAAIKQRPPRPGRLAYSAMALLTAFRRRIDVVFCGHLYMAPLAWLVARLKGAKLVIQMHGIEAWPRPSRLQRAAVEAADLIMCVSRYTRACVAGWAAIAPERVVVMPNTVEDAFAPGDGSALRTALGLEGRSGASDRRADGLARAL